LGFDTSSSESVGLARSYDVNGDGTPETPLSGDLSSFNEVYRMSSPDEQPTLAQTARFLIQSTFGPASLSEVQGVANIGFPAWIDLQMAMPASMSAPYVLAIKEDFENGIVDGSLVGYAAGDPNVAGTFVFGVNFMTSYELGALSFKSAGSA